MELGCYLVVHANQKPPVAFSFSIFFSTLYICGQVTKIGLEEATTEIKLTDFLFKYPAVNIHLTWSGKGKVN